jgi:hypothetical protein
MAVSTARSDWKKSVTITPVQGITFKKDET